MVAQLAWQAMAAEEEDRLAAAKKQSNEGPIRKGNKVSCLKAHTTSSNSLASISMAYCVFCSSSSSGARTGPAMGEARGECRLAGPLLSTSASARSIINALTAAARGRELEEAARGLRRWLLLCPCPCPERTGLCR